MKSVANLSRLELAGLVCTTLTDAGIDAVLVGGSCVSIYTNEAFVSLDLDFVVLGIVSNKKISLALDAIGFTPSKSNSRYFEHAETDLVLEFPPSPLMIGDEYIPESNVDDIETEVGVVRLLSPTDCIKDRLANCYYSNDRQCYEQAKMVAHQHGVDWASLKRWHENEGQHEEYEIFFADVKDH